MALQCDIVGPLTRFLQNNIYIFTIVDTFSRHLEAFPLRNLETRTVIKKFNEYFARYVLPQ